MVAMEPVWVWEGAALRRQLNDVGDAALFLLYKWPKQDMTSKAHHAARVAALAALEGTGTAEVFREAFIAAAERVELIASAPMRSDVKLPGHVARPWDMPWAKKRRKR